MNSNQGLHDQAANVLRSGNRLLSALDGDDRAVEYAIDDLVGAADNEDRSFRLAFEEETKDRGVTDHNTVFLITTIVLDVRVANVLIAASGAAGEIGRTSTTSKAELSTALEQLAASSSAASSPETTGSKTTTQQLGDLPDSVAYVLSKMTADTQSVMHEVYDRLKGLNLNDVMKAYHGAEKIFDDIPRVARLFTRGIARIRRVMANLASFVEATDLDETVKKLRELYISVTDGVTTETYTKRFLQSAFKSEETIAIAHDIAQSRVPAQASLDATFDRLREIEELVGSKMNAGKAVVISLAIAAGLLALLHAPGALVIAGLCLVTLGVCVLIAMDYADTTVIVSVTPGIRSALSAL